MVGTWLRAGQAGLAHTVVSSRRRRRSQHGRQPFVLVKRGSRSATCSAPADSRSARAKKCGVNRRRAQAGFSELAAHAFALRQLPSPSATELRSCADAARRGTTPSFVDSPCRAACLPDWSSSPSCATVPLHSKSADKPSSSPNSSSSSSPREHRPLRQHLPRSPAAAAPRVTRERHSHPRIAATSLPAVSAICPRHRADSRACIRRRSARLECAAAADRRAATVRFSDRWARSV